MKDRAARVHAGTRRRWLLLLLLAFGAGYLLRGCIGPRQPDAGMSEAASAATAAEVWTCSMHPQVRLPRPGTCPICEMPLIVAAAAQVGAGGKPMLQLDEHARTMAGIETTPVTRRELVRELRAVGKIQYSESSLATVTTRIDGYAERLFVDFTGVAIKAGDHLAEIYSPELLVAQQELLIAVRGGTGTGAEPLAAMAKVKLRRWGMTQEQIADLVEKGTIADRITLYSPIGGTVIEKSIVQNSAFKAGDALYRVANLDTVWVYLDIYEVDLPWVRYGQSVEITAEAVPGRVFEGRVTFVQPLVSEESRTIRVPVHVANLDHALTPGMFVSARVRSSLAPDGRAAPTGVEGQFSCPMHPEVLREQAGNCPVCEMPLERIPAAAPAAAADAPHGFFCPMKCEGEKTYDDKGNCPVCGMRLVPTAASSAPAAAGAGLLAVPVSAVLDSGTRRIVYVEHARGMFEAREVSLGPRADGYFAVLKGLEDGERVATRGGFLIDSQFQITGHPSLFYPGGLMGGAGDAESATAEAVDAATTNRPSAAAPLPGTPRHQH